MSVMNRILLAILILLSGTSVATGQDAVYHYGVNGKILENDEGARLRKRIWKTPTGYREKIYTRQDGDWMWIRTEKTIVFKSGKQNVRYRHETLLPKFYLRYAGKPENGIYSFRIEKQGVTLSTGTATSLFPLHLDGRVTEFYSKDQVRSESVYKDNELVSNKNYNEDGSDYIHDVFYSADRQPLYGPGQKALQNYLMALMVKEKLPMHEIQDEVLVGGVVLETGQLTGIRIMKGKVESVNDFFRSTFESLPGEWEPAVLNGKKVRYFITFPVNFINQVPSLQHLELTPGGGQLLWHY